MLLGVAVKQPVDGIDVPQCSRCYWTQRNILTFSFNTFYFLFIVTVKITHTITYYELSGELTLNISATYGSPRALTGHDRIVLALCVKEYVLL